MGICNQKKADKVNRRSQKLQLESTQQRQTINSDPRTSVSRPSKIISFQVYKTPISKKNMVLKKNTPITQDYTLQYPPIGKGAFGQVYRGVQKSTKLPRAIKKINRSIKISSDQIRVEINNLINLVIDSNKDHPNIVKIIEFYQTDRCFYLVTQMLTGKELFDRIIEERRFTEVDAVRIMEQILSALNYCHGQGLVHRQFLNKRDIKPQNLIFQNLDPESTLKLIDFGTSLFVDVKQQLVQRVGTAYYIAPQVLKKKYDMKCDIWSAGVVMYMLLSGEPPFNAQTDQQIMKSIQIGKFSFSKKIWNNVSPEAKDLIQKMLTYDPHKRISASDALKHEWMFINKQRYSQVRLISQSIESMRKFYVLLIQQNLKKFQQGICSYIINFITSNQEKQSLLSTFKIFDKNNDGIITKEELMEGYEKVYGKRNQLQIDKIFKTIDTSKTGEINYSQFVFGALQKSKIINDENLQKVFKLIDTNNDGCINTEQLRCALGKNTQDKIYGQMMKQVKSRQKGVIEKQQFFKIMKQVLI